MPTTTYKVLGQAQATPAGPVVYSAPSTKSAVISTISLANTSFVDTAVSLHVDSPNFLPTTARTLSWSSTPMPINTSWMTYGNSIYAALAGIQYSGLVRYSTNAVTWTTGGTAAVNGVNESLVKIIFTGGKFFTLGSASYISSSTDTLSWSGANLTVYPNDVAYGGGTYVVAMAASGGSSKYARSTDGISWTTATLNVSNGSPVMNAVTYGNGTFVIGGGNGCISISTNGSSWSAQPVLFSGNTITALEFGNGIFVAAYTDGSNGLIATSTDGITWTTRNSNFGTGGTNGRIGDLTFGGNTFMYSVSNQGGAPTDKGTGLRLSTDGITWTTISGYANKSYSYANVGYADGAFFANTGSELNDLVFSNKRIGLDNALVYQSTIPANSTTNLTLGLSLATGEGLYASSTNSGAVTVHAFGGEIS